MQRMGMCIRLKPETVAEYLRLHRAVWPEVLATISACQIRNYSIFLKQPENILFATWEYHGADFAADMARMAADLEDAGMVGAVLALPGAVRDPEGGGVVGDDAGGVPPRLTSLAPS